MRLWQDALTAYQAGEWADAEDLILGFSAVRRRRSVRAGMLFDLYVNLAAESEQAGDLEQALAYVDQALELRPENTALRTARSMAAMYQEMLAVSGVDWEQTIELLEGLYVRDSGYRDVQERLQAALLAYGEQLAEAGDWCEAAAQYRAAVAIESSPATIAQRNSLEERCEAERGPSSLASAGATPTRAVAALTDEPADETGH